MCGHRLALTQALTAEGEVSAGEPIAQDEAYEDSVTLSFVLDARGAPLDAGSVAAGGTPSVPPATRATTDPVCEICGKAVGEGEALCNACARLVASSERDDG
jgi:hypothetical protein